MSRVGLLAANAAVVALTAGATVAQAAYINGYAVGNHRSCGANNLPGTISELQKFFASRNLPADATKNFLWTDRAVKLADWASATDYHESQSTASGYDGVDSGLIAYIASHGATSGGRYLALAGGADGCEIRNGNMGLGDQDARYLVLSTCQGLKIGTGDDPRRAGEDPTRTWRSGSSGLNCILGYSNNMVDADEYGEYLLTNLASGNMTVADAFFRASRDISYSNIPAVLCYGPDEATARSNIETLRTFTEERFGTGASAYAYQQARRLDSAFLAPREKVLRTLAVSRRTPSLKHVSRALLGASVDVGTDGALTTHRAERGTVAYDAATNQLSWSAAQIAPSAPLAMKDAQAVQLAHEFLAPLGLVADADADLVPTYVIDRGSSFDGHAAVVGKTVVFHQRVQGLTPLSTTGSVEVAIGSDGAVVGLQARLVNAAAPRIPEWIDAVGVNTSRHRDAAVARLHARMPRANLTVLDARVGYDVASANAQRANAVVEVLVEAEEGGFARRYVEKVGL
jgi:hypothetical protein